LLYGAPSRGRKLNAFQFWANWSWAKHAGRLGLTLRIVDYSKCKFRYISFGRAPRVDSGAALMELHAHKQK
jgi:hypothetical protein